MGKLGMILMAAMLAACATPKKETGVLAATCGSNTPVQVADLAQFGFKPAAGKIGVMRIFATWCPYCKEDLSALGGLFAKGQFTPENTQVYLLAFKNSRETKAGFDQFVKKVFPSFGIPQTSAQIIYVDKNFEELSKAASATGAPMFTGWQGMPFGLVFGKDGRLAFRGHFTTSPQFQDNHYDFITGLTKESCP